VVNEPRCLLLGGLEHEFYFSRLLGISSSQLTNSYFSGVETTNQFILENDDSTNPRCEPWWYIYLQNWMFGVNVGIHVPTPWFAYGVAQPPTRLTTYICIYIYLVAHPTARKWVITPVIYMG
jgi:hypothetical protein